MQGAWRMPPPAIPPFFHSRVEINRRDNAESVSQLLRCFGYYVFPSGLEIIHPRFRGQGIGGRLLNFAREFAKKKGVEIMKCHIIEKKDCAVARIFGPADGKTSFLIKDIVHTEFDGCCPRIILDMANMDDSNDITTQLSVITAFKKEVDMMNGFLKICSLKPRVKDYLLKNRLDRIFDIYEDLGSAEKSPWERKRYGKEQQRDTGTAA